MLKLYGQYRSRAFRVAWLLKESNVPYDHVNVTINVEGATCKDPAYVALNPNARVPTIDDDGFVMWESAAINLYLAEKYRSPLWPPDMKGKGRAYQWAFFIANDVEPHMIAVMQHRVMFPPEKRDARLADGADAKLQPRLKVLDEHLSKNKFFDLDHWGLADFMVASV
ncbi:MAG TPA: glutathione S-transferase family protein, partial [Burkholderiales bacterium]